MFLSMSDLISAKDILMLIVYMIDFNTFQFTIKFL